MSKITDAIDAESIAFAQTFIKQRREALTRKKANVTGELADSMDFEATKQAGDEAATLLLAFADEGRFLDMRPTSFNYEHDNWGRNAIERIQKWVEKRGFDKFFQGWLKRRGLTTTRQDHQKVLNSIAWGIAIKRTDGKFRRKTWWNKAKSAGIATLANNVVAALPDPTAETVIDNLQN